MSSHDKPGGKPGQRSRKPEPQRGQKPAPPQSAKPEPLQAQKPEPLLSQKPVQQPSLKSAPQQSAKPEPLQTQKPEPLLSQQSVQQPSVKPAPQQSAKPQPLQAHKTEPLPSQKPPVQQPGLKPEQQQSPKPEQQQDGKKQFDAALASATTLSIDFQTIATAYSDYSKKSFEQTKAFVEKLSGVRSLDKAIEIQTEFAKQAYETFVTESQKIRELYSGLAKQSFRPFEALVAKAIPAAR